MTTVTAGVLLACGCAGRAPGPERPAAGTGELVVHVRNELAGTWRMESVSLLVDGEQVGRAEAVTMDGELVDALEPGASRELWRGELGAGEHVLEVRASVWSGGPGEAEEVVERLAIEVPARTVAVLARVEVLGPGEVSVVMGKVPIAEIQGPQMCLEVKPEPCP
jgi:hypothetical protein